MLRIFKNPLRIAFSVFKLLETGREVGFLHWLLPISARHPGNASVGCTHQKPAAVLVHRCLPFEDAAFLTEAGARELSGEAGYSTLERLWSRPTCEVNGILAGYTGEGAKTVLPAEAMAKVSFRLVPDQDPDEIGDLFRAHVRRAAAPGVEVEVVGLHGGRPWKAEQGGPFFEAARGALREVFGVDPVLTGEGGSIPIVAELERLLGARAVLMGFALPGANMHAPNEWFPEEHLVRGIETLSAFYARL